MANVFFKNGSQARYDALTTRDAGTFYVTSDTHRLYLGNDLLSQAVKIIAYTAGSSVATLLAEQPKTSGQIYYLEGHNILAIYDANSSSWVQLNPDTSVESFTTVVSAIADNGGAQITNQLTENRGTHKTTPITQTVKITGSNGNVVSVNGTDTINIAAPELSVATATDGAKLSLDDTNVEIVGGTNTTVKLESGKIKIDSTYTDHKITTAEMAVTANATAGFDHVVTLTDALETEKITTGTVNIDPVVKVVTSKTKDATTYSAGTHFVSGAASLDVYSTDAVDTLIQEKLNEINGMTYKGILKATNGQATLPTSQVKIGDTWMLGEAATIDGVAYMPGTIFVATGTETNGVITSDLKYDSVKTSDSDTTFALKYLGDNKVYLNGSNTASQNSGTIEFVGGNKLTATVAQDGAATSTKVTLDHDTVTVTKTTLDAATQEKGTDQKVTVVEEVVADAYGHVTEIKTRETTIKDTVTKVNSLTTTTADATKGVQVTVAVGDDQNGGASDSFTVTSESLTITQTAKAINAELVWGTF